MYYLNKTVTEIFKMRYKMMFFRCKMIMKTKHANYNSKNKTRIQMTETKNNR